MKERPILFGDELVRAILDGRKTETRRPMATGRVYATGGTLDQTWLPIGRGRCITLRGDGTWPAPVLEYCPFGVVGDRLWVRECWAAGACADGFAPGELHAGTWRHDNGGLWYRADNAVPRSPISPRGTWRPSIHMPRWASRIMLEITHVKVERLQGITEEGAEREGFVADFPVYTARGFFKDTWDAIYGGIDKNTEKPRPYGWDQNPWVWVISYKRLP